MSASDLHTAWARLFVRALATAGVRDVVVSPGSRSTPLTLAVATEPAVRGHVVIDERSAGFFALGQARITGRPSALLCTSGTAAAHYLPAVIEAGLCGLPLVVVTADRPWEAYDAAASQTIDQVKLFAAHVRHYAELGLPDPSPAALRAVPRIAAQAVRLARGPVPGPVHVNARFRKPLEPVVVGPEPWEGEVARLIEGGGPAVYEAVPEPGAAAVQALRRVISRARRPVIVCGPRVGGGDEARLREAVLALARAAGAPVLAEATSGLRFGGAGRGATVCGGFDAMLRDRGFRERAAPDVVVEFGMPPVSAGYASWLEAHAGVPRFVVAPYGWNDPLGTVTARVFGEPARLASEVAAALGTVEAGVSAWRALFEEAEARVWACAARELEGAALTEGVVAHRVVEALPPGAVLAVGNSSPVRDLDTYCPPSSRLLTVLHQRGAAGIDGLVSGAAGARSVAAEPVVLLLGDLSFLHDLTGLNAARAVPGPFVVVVVQNDGGRIFEELPVARAAGVESVFETYFATPQGLRFGAAAELFGFEYARVESPAALSEAMERALSGGKRVVVEAVVDARARQGCRGRLWKSVGESLAGLGLES